MQEFKKSWLRSKGLHNEPNIVDCDPFAGTVRFANGTTRQTVQVYTRVMGYHRPVEFFNVGKQSEHRERRYFRP